MTMSTQNKSMQEDEEGDEMNFSDEEGGLNVDGIYIPPPPEPYCSSENKGPRLIITKITNHFFKSYANNQELGPFHKCFNAIVGPNGSGKSNVIDSLLFVFGYRASKIRSKKISVLLHNSEKYSNVNSCTVSVHFCLIEDREGDDYDIVEGSEFVVARTAHKDNSSYYTLNGRKAQFKEIGKLLKSHGIDLDHNRFLILQGEVEQISLMSPKGTDNEPGMLEYLEDIIGTTRYKVPLAKLSHRVEELSEKRSEKLNRLKIVQTELDELKGPKDEAVEFLKLENDIITKKNFIYQKTVASLEEAAVGVNNDKEKIDGALEELRGRLKEIGKEKKLKAEKLHEVSQKCDSLQKRKECLKIAFDKANTKDIQLQAEMTEINKKRKRTKELLEEEKKNLENYKRTPEESVKKIEKIESKDADLLSKKEELEEKKIALLASIRNETKALQAEKEALQNKLIGLNKIVDDNKSAYTLAESELKLYTSTQENEARKYENLKKTQETSEAKIASNGNELRKLELMIPESENQIEKATRELVVLKNEEMKILTELRKKRSNLEEVTSSMQASRSKGRVLDSLMQQKMEGRCPGLFGRLGDLGAIDPKYDVAVSTACGALDHIIVDTVDTAQWCIEFLKKHDVGRANFIALEKQEHLWNYCRNRIETPEGVPRLFDLIRVEDERVLPAFYYALRNTLVAKDLEQGSRIGYGAQRYRVVTLGGDLIETTGTMSGGGKQVSRGRMGQSVATLNVSTQDIDKMETDVSNLEGRLGEIRQQIMKYENDISDLTPQCRQMKIAFDKLTMELNALKQQQPNLVKQLKAQEAKMKSTKVDASTLKELTNTVNEAKTKYENALTNSNEQQEKVDVINQEINEKSCGKMKKLDQELKEVIKTIDKAKADVTKLKVGLKTAERNAIKSEEKIVIMQQDIKNAEDTLRSLKAQRDEIEEDAKKLLSCIEEITSEIENEEDVSEMKGSVDNLTKKENKLKAEIIEVEEEMNTMNEKLNDIKARIKSWLHKIESLKLQEIPDETTTPLKTYTPEELNARDLQSVQKELHAYEEEFKLAKPNLNAITEYNKKQQVFITRAADLNEVTEQRKKIRGYYDNLSTRRKDEFIAGYNIIKLKLKEMYQMITLGGDADFEMLDNFDPFNEGIQFRVRPPKKTWKLITNLSGGEKTLSSLALVFALHYYKPSPLYVMDEIDAALDFKNVSIVGNYIKERTKNAQFIIISLRSNMFELSDYLHGIYKTYNCTQTLTIDPRTLGKLVRTCSENSEEGNENQEDVGFQLFQ